MFPSCRRQSQIEIWKKWFYGFQGDGEGARTARDNQSAMLDPPDIRFEGGSGPKISV